MVHGSAGSTQIGIAKNLWAPAKVGRDFDLSAEQPGAARAVPGLPDDRQQHRRAERRSVQGAGNRRRSLPIAARVPHAVASRSRRRARTSTSARRSIRSTRRSIGQETAIPSMQLCIESGRSGRRLRLRLLVRVHRHDQLGVAGPAAADGARSARRVRSAVRRRRDAGRARREPPRRQEHPRLDHGRGRRTSTSV